MKFLYNRTSVVVSNPNDSAASSANKSPLQVHSTMNPSFKLNAPPNVSLKSIAGLKMLPKRVRDVAQSLSIKSSFLFEKTRTKELNAQITDQIRSGLENNIPMGDILVQTKTVPAPIIETSNGSTQTADFKCERCTERNKRIMVSAHTQVFLKNCSIGVQTNEKDYREPIVELLSKMSAAQLVALKDFANIVDEPRPQNSMEMYKIRERLMDIYNLSQRDADAVRSAEENRLDDMHFIEQVRYRQGDMYTEGSSRDFDRRSRSPHNFNGNNIMEPISFNNDRNMIDDRKMPQRTLDERFQRMDDSYRRSMHPDEDEEMERQRYIEMERRRQLQLELTQRRYDEEQERRRLESMEQEQRIQMQNVNFPGPPNHSMQFDDDMRHFSRDPDDREMQRQPLGFGQGQGRGAMNRRGRGAFRDNFRGKGSRR